jgi:hypothetical protein
MGIRLGVALLGAAMTVAKRASNGVARALIDVRGASLELLAAQEERERFQRSLNEAKERVRWAETNLRAATAVLRLEEAQARR